MKSNLTLVAIVALAFFWQSSCGNTVNNNSTATQNTITTNGNSTTLNSNSTVRNMNADSPGVNANAKAPNSNNSNSNARPANTNSNAQASNANSASAPPANSQSNVNATRPGKKVIKPPFYGDLGNDAQRAPDTEPAPNFATPGVPKLSCTPAKKPTPRPD